MQILPSFWIDHVDDLLPKISFDKEMGCTTKVLLVEHLGWYLRQIQQVPVVISS